MLKPYPQNSLYRFALSTFLTGLGLVSGLSGLLVAPEANAESAPTCQIGTLPRQPGNLKLGGNAIIRRLSTKPLAYRRIEEDEKQAYGEAINCFEEALKAPQTATDPEVWNGYGVALARLGKYEEAIKAYDRGLAIPPGGRYVDRLQPPVRPQDYYILWFNRGTALGDLERYDQALENLERAIRLNPSYGLAHFYKGLYLFRQGKIEQAQDAYVKATAFSPYYNYYFYRRDFIGDDNYLYWEGRGFALSRIERYEPAAEAFREAEKINRASGNSTPPHVALFIEANDLALSGDFQGGLQKCEQALQIKANFAMGHHCRGLMLDRQKRYAEAVAAFDNALKLEPDSPSAMYRKGNALRKQGKLREAIAAYQQALNRYPLFFEAQNNLGAAHYELRQDQLALTAFNRALQPEMESFDSDVNPRDTLYNKGLVLCTMRRYRESISTLDDLIRRENRPEAKARATKLREAVARNRCS